MIPTVVIVNDKNERLNELKTALSHMVRVVDRDSFQGEQLYGIFEGVLYFDSQNQRQLKRQDEYVDVIPLILKNLKDLGVRDKKLLFNYLREKHNPVTRLFPKEVQKQLPQEIQTALADFLQEVYESKKQ